jgi:hypothetical protein
MGRRRSIGLERRHVMIRAGDFEKIKRYYPQVNPSVVIAKLISALIDKNELLQATRMPKLTLEVNLDELPDNTELPTERGEASIP